MEDKTAEREGILGRKRKEKRMREKERALKK